MANAKAGLTVITILIIVLFVISLYLMTIVNPAPLVTTTSAPPADAGDRLIADSDAIPGREATVKDAYCAELAVPAGKLSHGLETASQSEKVTGKKNDSNLVPLYRKLAANGLLVNSSEVKEVSSPIKNPTEVNQISMSPTSSTVDVPSLTASVVNAEIPSTPSVKGFRRSVKDVSLRNRIIEPRSGVILKIIDDFGHPRIEIKLEPKSDVEEKRRYYRSYTNDSKDDEKETFIKILHNNTFIIEEPQELRNIANSNFNSSIEGKENNSRRYKEITLMLSNEQHINVTTNETVNTKSKDITVNFTGLISNSTSNKINNIGPSLEENEKTIKQYIVRNKKK